MTAVRSALAVVLALTASGVQAAPEPQGTAGAPYTDMPEIAPIGVRIGKYLDVPESSKGPPVDPAKGYRLQTLGAGLFMVTDNAYQSMFLVYESGVVVVDAPPSWAAPPMWSICAWL